MRSLIIVLLTTLITVSYQSIDDLIKEGWEHYSREFLKDKPVQEKRDESGHREPLHRCIHDETSHVLGLRHKFSKKTRETEWKNIVTDNDIEYNKKRQTQTFGPLRIHVDTAPLSNDQRRCSSAGQTVTLDSGISYTCKSEDIVTQAKRELLQNNVLPTLRNIILQLLQVKRTSGNLVLSKSYHDWAGINCGRPDLPVPSNMVEPGVGMANIDYYLLISARPLPTGVLANAVGCSFRFIDSQHVDRPLAGSVNFNPASEAFTPGGLTQSLYNELILTALHEVTHALGFTSWLYGDYQTPNGGFYDPNPIQGYLIRTPRVTATARDHYNCQTFTGMLLENDDTADASPGSHWERRVIPSELMSPVSAENAVLSDFTLSLFEDMGWYIANYSMSNQIRYGYKAGCSFFNGCSGLLSAGYTCSGTGLGCNGDRDSLSTCRSNGIFYDSCSVFLPALQGYCLDPSNPPRYPSEYFGSSSRCFMVTDITPQPRCHEHSCTVNPGNNATTLQVRIQSTWVTCPTAGGSASGGGVTIQCPPAEFFCHSTSPSPWTYQGGSIPVGPPPGSSGFNRPPPDFFTGSPTGFNIPIDQWGLTVGSTLFWVLIGISIFIAVIICLMIILCCCCGSD